MSRPFSSAPAAPSDTYQESVLSTRTLSYTSVAAQTDPRNPTSRKSTLTAIPDTTTLDIEMTHSSSASSSTSTGTTPSSLAPIPSPDLPTSVSLSPLFRLPRELRQQIYTYLLSSLPLGINFPASSLDRALTPQLLRVSRPLYTETLPVLYATNKLIFSHPSDANIFSHALANASTVRTFTSELILRVRNSDARLWTAYFNSNSEERSLMRDFPALRKVTVRFRGVRYAGHLGPEENAMAWLREKSLVEVVTSVRKCAEVWVEICVKVPEGWKVESFERALEGVVRGGRGRRGEEQREEQREDVGRRKNGASWFWEGVWVKVETEGT
ncbi:hypothetical protein B9Z65_3200 [Elsinoe australis]|uniref:Uncharacterized protein n=1 Tax=Elsinoe australis TaxID=40998 RepID=A0A2P7ZUP5_9PEZI|nr:hypothetical protein B9Z65_3200 [Elsinoe australis]